jgi:hypothetical protein
LAPPPTPLLHHTSLADYLSESSSFMMKAPSITATGNAVAQYLLLLFSHGPAGIFDSVFCVQTTDSLTVTECARYLPRQSKPPLLSLLTNLISFVPQIHGPSPLHVSALRQRDAIARRPHLFQFSGCARTVILLNSLYCFSAIVTLICALTCLQYGAFGNSTSELQVSHLSYLFPHLA